MDLTRLEIPAPAADLVVIGTGGAGRERPAYRDGERTGEPVRRDGAAVHRLSGVAVSLAGVGLDGATVETTTPLESVPAGTIFKASGAVEVSVRADARPGFGNRGARGVLAVVVFAERLEPAGDVTALLAGKPSKAASASAGSSARGGAA